MNIGYRLFVVNDDGNIIAAKDGYSDSYLEFSSEEEAIEKIEHSSEPIEYIILKTVSRDTNIVDELIG